MIDENITKPAVRGSVEQVLSQLVSNANVDTIFGKPIERDGATIIPCSEIAFGFGMGSGAGPVDERGNPTGGGSGGGGGSQGRPVAVIVMTREGVRIEPVLDVTKVALAGITTGAFMLLWLGRLTGLGRKDKGPSLSQLKKAIRR
ncbi:MAG TPA: spore germination protein GerW family protein [Ktedonobacteraceae bacterium]|nr:spore germination protein GerW family protein [Ktedonobacteraceae bacterium]